MKKLSVGDVAEAVSKVYALRDDPEAAHAAEDKLHQMVLGKIAAGMCDDAEGCARQALMTQGIDFARWCA